MKLFHAHACRGNRGRPVLLVQRERQIKLATLPLVLLKVEGVVSLSFTFPPNSLEDI